MKTLILFRHAKSDWDADTGRDRDRPLSSRGMRAARVMGRFLSLAAQLPDSVVTSSALRARTTVELAAEAGAWKCPIRVNDALYEATPFKILEEIRREPEPSATLLLGGHEPTWSELGSLLVGGGTLMIPTATMVRIDFGLDTWASIAYGEGALVWLVPPRLFTKGEFDFAGKE